MNNPPFKFLLHGIDTLQCAYYLRPESIGTINFEKLNFEKELLRRSRKREPKPITLGSREFMLQPHGSSSGYPLIISDENFRIEFGKYNKPNFYVTFRSQALWRDSAYLLHEKFLEWAASVRYCPDEPEMISRVDFSFDYLLKDLDFDEDSFISRSNKDSQYRENGKIQTFNLGVGDIRLRIYDKVDEIRQKSSKVWFFELWEQEEKVWRIEWQIRKSILKKFRISTFADLYCRQGDILRYLAHEHDTLRKSNNDINASRWPLHPLWIDLQSQIENLKSLGISKINGKGSALQEREFRIGIAVLGYLKRFAAIKSVQEGKKEIDFDDARQKLNDFLSEINDPLTWIIDVPKKVKEIELGEW